MSDDISNHVEYRDPASIAEGEAVRSRLAEELLRISTQLGDHDRRDPEGRRLNWAEYAAWRKRAKYALQARQAVMRRLNAWLESARRLAAVKRRDGTEVANTYALVNDAYALLQKLHVDEVEFEPEEWRTIEALRRYLETQCPAALPSSL